MTVRFTPLARGAAAASIALAAFAAHADFSFAVSPPRFELAAKPGERLRQTIEITNASARANGLTARTADWDFAADESVNFKDELQPGSCRPWAAIERRELSVAPNQSYRFRFEVAPPAGTPPVECRFAILLEGKEPTLAGASGNVPVAARVGVIVYVAVGDVKPDLTVAGARVERRGGKPVALLDIKNSGNAHGRLDGFLTATDAEGRTLEATPGSSPILAGETRAIPLVFARRGDSGAAVEPVFPVTVKGKLEWGKGRATELDQRFTP